MTTRIVRLLAAGAAACTLALAAVADVGLAQATGSQPPESGTAPWLRARLENRLDARTRSAVERVIDSVGAAGIPAEPLVSKALQGAAMRAPSERIVTAVRQLAQRLGVARGVL